MTDADRHLMTIFTGALDRDSEPQRAAYLDEACGADAGLRERVDALLRAHEQAGGFLEPRGTAAFESSSAASAAPNPVAGTVIAGRYKLIEEIGDGGMGTVWMAQQTEPVKRAVAVKLIKAGMDSKQVLARFEAERQALALMDHPNIARVLDAGAIESGRPFFVMELVKGVPITKYCDEHRLTPRQRLELFVPVCQAVQHAHQKGIIHRDIKPSNILIAQYDGRPVPKVIDFGVAKAAGQQLTDKTLMTGFGAVVGTLEYMSPEQAELNQLDIDTRTDIYSLGVVLYELLTGSTPLDRQRLKEAAFAEILRLIREEEPQKPSTRLSGSKDSLPSISAQRHTEPAKLTKLVRGELDWIVMKALDKDRNRRYETANGFAMDVQRYLADEPVLACPPSVRYRLRKFVRRNKTALAVAAGVVLALTVMSASITWAVRDRLEREAESQRVETARRAQVAEKVRGSWNAARALFAENNVAAARQKLAEAQAQLGNDRSALPDLATEIEAGAAELDRFDRFLELIDRAHEAETAPTLQLALPEDSSHSAKGTAGPVATRDRRPDKAAPFLLQALDCFGILERDDWSTTLEQGVLGRGQVEQIRRSAYEELLWLALDLLERQQDHRSGGKLSKEAAAQQVLNYVKRAESGHRPTQFFYWLRGGAYLRLGNKAAFDAEKQLYENTPPTLALDHDFGAQVMFSGQVSDKDVQAYEAALFLEPTGYWSMIRLGQMLNLLGRGPADFTAATRVYTGCIMKRPDHAFAYSCRSNAYDRLGKYDWAIADAARAIQLDPNDARAWFGRAHAYQKLGQYDKAVADYSQAIKLDPEEVKAWHNRGVAYSNLGQNDRAVADHSKAIELNSKLAQPWTSRGLDYAALGVYDKAVADCSKAIQLDPESPDYWNNRGKIYSDDLNQQDKALADFSKAIELDKSYAIAWLNRGHVYRKMGQFTHAVANYSRALELTPKLVDALRHRGVVYGAHLGQEEKAVADFSKAIELEPNNAIHWANRGNSYFKLGQYDKAFADCSKSIELDPKCALALQARGCIYCDHLGQPEKAVADFSKAIELHPNNAILWCNRGNAYRAVGQYDKAIADCSKAIELEPKNVIHWFVRGFAYIGLGQYDEVIADYSKAIEVNPKHAGAHNGLAWVLATCPDVKLRDPNRAVELAKKAVQLAPNDSDNWGALGAACYRASDWKAAVAAVHTSMEKRKGGNAYDWFILAMSHWKLGDRIDARKKYDEAIQWMDKNEATLRKDKIQAEELGRFRSEAEEVLELKKK